MTGPPQNHKLELALEHFIEALFDHQIDLPFAQSALEKRFIKRKLQNNRGNISQTAKELGMHRNTLSKRMKDLGIK